jgi:hypothetical protein
VLTILAPFSLKIAGHNLWCMENGSKLAPQPFKNEEMFYGNYFSMDSVAQQDDLGNFCNETDSELLMSTIPYCDLDLNLNLNTPHEGQVKGEFSGYQRDPESYIQPQLEHQPNNMQFQPRLNNNSSSSYYGVGGRC